MYVNFLSNLTRLGEPSAAASVGQNFCHKNAVKCGFVCTFRGSVDANERMHSVRNNDPPVSFFLGLEILQPENINFSYHLSFATFFRVHLGSIRRLHSHCITGITSLYTAVACAAFISPDGVVDFKISSASSCRNEQNVRRH